MNKNLTSQNVYDKCKPYRYVSNIYKAGME